MHDMELDNLGCVVSDEIHYINDVERGAVWEETLMHLPPQVQLVALSATLSEPENFLAWIELARGRPGRIVLRKVRARARARLRGRTSPSPCPKS